MAKKFDLKLKGYVGGYDFDSNYVEYILEKKRIERSKCAHRLAGRKCRLCFFYL